MRSAILAGLVVCAGVAGCGTSRAGERPTYRRTLSFQPGWAIPEGAETVPPEIEAPGWVIARLREYGPRRTFLRIALHEPREGREYAVGSPDLRATFNGRVVAGGTVRVERLDSDKLILFLRLDASDGPVAGRYEFDFGAF